MNSDRFKLTGASPMLLKSIVKYQSLQLYIDLLKHPDEFYENLMRKGQKILLNWTTLTGYLFLQDRDKFVAFLDELAEKKRKREQDEEDRIYEEECIFRRKLEHLIGRKLEHLIGGTVGYPWGTASPHSPPASI